MFDNGGEDNLERYEQGQGHIQKGPNARADIHVSLEEMYIGSKRTLNINRNVYCGDCSGTGAKDGKLKICPKCQGRGIVMQNVQMGFMQMQMQTHCDKCGGKGKTMAAKCPHCHGQRLVNDNTQVSISIDKGMANGDTIILQREGEQVPDMQRGDLIFTIKQRPHDRFKRVGNNLYIEVDLTLEESLLGFKKVISHLDGKEVTLKTSSEEIIQPESWHILKGFGMPIRNQYNQYGDLHVKFKVKLPTKISPEKKALIEQIFIE